MSQPDQLATATHLAAKGIDRRTVITTAGVVGVGVLGAATLTACGGSSDTAAPVASPASSPTSSAGSGSDEIKVADIPVGGGKVFKDTKIVVTQPKAGEFEAFSAICKHKGCTVNKVANGTIDCPCHGSKYDMTTGAVTAGPAPAPLDKKTATVKGDLITVT
jgi:Rieske Fe-S protein